MRLPQFECRFAPDSPRDLIQVIMRIGPAEVDMRCGTGVTLYAAIQSLADDIALRATYDDDRRMRVILEGDREA